jgi:c-di-GMP-binding flagellar brake protein YcgR
MEEMRMAFERRKYTRYLVRADAYAAFGSNFTKMGNTKDVSIGGLAFDYIKNSEDQGKEPFKVSIFLTKNEFFVWCLPCRLIYDFSWNSFDDNQESNSFYVHRRCGLQFTDISEDQRQSLEYFCIHHTRGLALCPIETNNN